MVGIVAISNCNSVGRLVEFSEMIMQRDMIGMVCVNSGSSVAPHAANAGNKPD